MQATGYRPEHADPIDELLFPQNSGMPIETAIAEPTSRYEDVLIALRRTTSADPFGQLLGQIAHDFNNVLSVAVTGSEVAQSLAQDERVSRFLGSSLRALQGGQRLTTRLADVSRSKYSAESVNVGDFIVSMREILQARLGDECALELQLTAHNHVALTDVLMLGVALLNLADNAREALPQGGRWILSTCNEAREGLASAGSYLILDVVDSAAGWTEEARTHAFDLFFSTKSEQRGLGLAQVRDLARRSDGFAQLEDNDRNGVQLRLGLPLAQPA